MKTLDQFNVERIEFWQSNKTEKNGIACPLCGKELIDSADGIVLTSSPPKVAIRCLSCHFKGLRIA